MLMKKLSIFFIILIFFISCGENNGNTIKVSIKGTNFTIECARTLEEQRTGLMHRKKLDRRRGMIFIYPDYVQSAFWMKNTYIPLSIAFLSENGEILDIKDMEPLSKALTRSAHPYRYALEVNQGVFKEIGTRIGDYVVFPKGFK